MTPGKTGCSGKCPLNSGKAGSTSSSATICSPGTHSTTRVSHKKRVAMWQNRHNLVASTRIRYCHGGLPLPNKKRMSPDSTTNIQPHLTPATKHSAKSLHLSTSDVVIPNPTSTSKVSRGAGCHEGRNALAFAAIRETRTARCPRETSAASAVFPPQMGERSQRAIVAAKAQRVDSATFCL